LLIVKCIKTLGNSMRKLLPHQKRLLYKTCILSIILYGFPLWYFNKASLLYPLKELRKIQQRAALWILAAFHTSPSLGIKMIACLIPIHLHFQKLSGKHQLKISALLSNHTIKSIFESRLLQLIPSGYNIN